MDTSRKQTFLEAYDAHADAIFRFCYVHTGDREQANDATQEAFVRTWKYLAQGRAIDQIRPFLYQTARNVLIDQHRRQRTDSLETMMETGFDVHDPRPDPAAAAHANLAFRSMNTLEPQYREVLTLRFIEDLPPREIAKITGENENTISVRIHRGLEKLRELLKTDHE